MSPGTESSEAGSDDVAPASLIDALLVYAEPLASGAHAIVVGNAESSIADRLLDLGARSVHVFDPDPARAANAGRAAPRGVTVRALVDELDVRDGAFDLAVVPDLADLNDPRATVARLRRAVAANGAVVAMGRAKVATAEEEGEEPPFASDLGPAALDYAELYDLFAVQFDEVSLAGVVPFRGVVFAELGGEEESPAVSVDTRFAPAIAPSVFVVVAAQRAAAASKRERPALDPYAIVQVTAEDEGPRDATLALEAAFAAAQLKAELLSAQLDEARDRLVVSDVRSVEAAARLDRASAERDGALTRAMELEAVLAASQQTMATLERRLLEAEQGMLERDDRLAILSADLDAIRSARTPAVPQIDIAELVTRAERAEAALALALAEMTAREENAATHVDVRVADDIAELVTRAERAETALALNIADVAHIAEAHAQETASYEGQLRDRARFIAALEKELVRREQLVKELVASLEESREGTVNGVTFEAAAPMSAPAPKQVVDPAQKEEAARLRRKLDELAAEVARRDGELTARAWRITELENERERARLAAPSEEARPAPRDAGAEVELARIRDELDALRQALTQEHAARMAAESGEELARARSELARQAALLEQMRGRASS
jgi:hypothetical protein